MKLRHALFACALALTMGVPMTSAPSAADDDDFNAAVARVLKEQRKDDAYLGSLSDAEFEAFVACSQGIMATAPAERQTYVLDAEDEETERERFTEVSRENDAALMNQIMQSCN